MKCTLAGFLIGGGVGVVVGFLGIIAYHLYQVAEDSRYELSKKLPSRKSG